MSDQNRRSLHPPCLDSPSAIRHHLALGIERASLFTPGVRFVYCDKRNRVLVHCHVDHVPTDTPPADCRQTLQVFVEGAEVVGRDGALLIALTRPGPPVLVPADRRWFRIAHQVCAEREVRLLGVYVVTPRGQREVLLDDAL